MTYSVRIETDNAAFDPDPGLEVARILRKLADRLEAGADMGEPVRLMDYNGNTVGEARTETGDDSALTD